MNRELKFRAWDNVDYMSKPFTLFNVMLRQIEFTHDVTIMQFTSLHDKNGKEIYDGDIISRMDVYSSTKQTIEFIQGKFMATNRIRPKDSGWLSDNGNSYDLSFLLNIAKTG